MGRYKVNNDGTLGAMISGRGKAEYGASTVRTGSLSVTGIPKVGTSPAYKEITVTFDSPMPDANYELETSVGYQAFVFTAISNKTANGFRAVFTSIYTNSDIDITFTYTAYKLYTDTEYNAVLESGSCAHGTNEPFMAGQPIRTYLLGLDSSIKFATFTVDPTASTVTDKINTTEYFSYNCYKQGSSWRVVAINSNGNKMYIADVSSSTQGITWKKLVTESDIGINSSSDFVIAPTQRTTDDVISNEVLVWIKQYGSPQSGIFGWMWSGNDYMLTQYAYLWEGGVKKLQLITTAGNRATIIHSKTYTV